MVTVIQRVKVSDHGNLIMAINSDLKLATTDLKQPQKKSNINKKNNNNIKR